MRIHSRPAGLYAGILSAVLLLAFAPRGSRTLGYLCESAGLVAVGTIEKPVPAAPGGVAWAFAPERVLKGKAPGPRLIVWIPSFEPAPPFAAGEQVVLFLSPVPDQPVFRSMEAVGKGLWRIEGGRAGVAPLALLPALRALIAGLSGGDRDARLAALLAQAGDRNPRVREDAAADLARLCPAGCALDAQARARVMKLAREAPPGSAYRKSLLRAVGNNPRGLSGEGP